MPASTRVFIGRDSELAEIRTLLSGSDRMITLVGPGGIGKTTLAAEAVRSVRADADSGVRVHWVRLDGLTSDDTNEYEQVERVTAAAVVGSDFSGRSTWDALIDALDRRGPDGIVLVFDNCEHVIAGVRALMVSLLDAVPWLTVVATSHTPIGWVDERLFRVPPLSKAGAREMFKRRASLIGVPLDDGDDEIVAKICRHVHHQPLYINLAAGRLLRRPLSGILAELTGDADDRRMQWDSDSRAGAVERHHGVTNVMAWAYSLINDQERLLFARLAVFAAGYDNHPDDDTTTPDVGADLDAIVAICGDDEDTGDEDRQPALHLSRDEIEPLLARLANQSLITVHRTRDVLRYSLLESLRLFAWQKLKELDPDGPTRLASRHLRYYRDKVVDAAQRWCSPAETDLLAWARAAWDNLIAAMETSINAPGEARAGLEICLGLIELRVPFVRGSIREMRRWTERCLHATRALDPQPTELQITARSTICWLAVRQGQSSDAARQLEQCVATYLTDGESVDWRNQPEADLGLPPMLDLAWGTLMFMADRDPRAIVVLDRARRKFLERNASGSVIFAGMFAGLAAALLGTSERAHEIAHFTVSRARESGASWATSWAELSLAVTLIEHGDPLEAAELLRRTLAHQLAVRDQWGAGWSVELRTWALAQTLTTSNTVANERIATEIAHLAGGARTLRASLGIEISSMGTFADSSCEAITAAREVLGAPGFDAEFDRGTRLRPERFEVHRLALGEAVLPADRSSDEPWDKLSRAEKIVAIRAADGWTTTKIADSLGNSPKTIDRHIGSILHKLNISSRADIGDFIPAETSRSWTPNPVDM